MTDRIPVYGPVLDNDDVEAVTTALTSGWLGMGREVEGFEQRVLEAIGATDRQAVAVSTGFAALHVGMLVAGVGPGDEVIVPSLTHLADVQCILAAGGRPVFCDVDDATLCIDPERAAELVTDHTRAIVAMDYGCHLCDHHAIAELAARHGLRVIHDAAHAFGSRRDQDAVGTFSDICMFSFDPVKALTAIDAGVLVLKDPADVQKARELRLLGSDQPAEVMYQNSRTWDYDAVRVGFRYHLSNLHAALGAVQLGKLDRIRDSRQAACIRYQENLKGLDGIEAQPEGDFEGLNPFLYYIRVRPDERPPLRAYLSHLGIGTGLHWRPAHRHTLFSAFRRGPLDHTERAGDELVTLPLHSDMALELVDEVSDAIAAYFRDR